jgi:hypothetical protein
VQYKYNDEKGKKILGLKCQTLKKIVTETITYFDTKRHCCQLMLLGFSPSFKSGTNATALEGMSREMLILR